MKRSPFSQYFTALRKKKGYSVDFIASKGRVGIQEYLHFEEMPEKAPLSSVAKYLKLLNITTSEMHDLWMIVFKTYSLKRKPSKVDFTKNLEETKKNSQSGSNVLSLRGLRNINFRENEGEQEEC